MHQMAEIGGRTKCPGIADADKVHAAALIAAAECLQRARAIGTFRQTFPDFLQAHRFSAGKEQRLDHALDLASGRAIEKRMNGRATARAGGRHADSSTAAVSTASPAARARRSMGAKTESCRISISPSLASSSMAEKPLAIAER